MANENTNESIAMEVAEPKKKFFNRVNWKKVGVVAGIGAGVVGLGLLAKKIINRSSESDAEDMSDYYEWDEEDESCDGEPDPAVESED